MKLITLLLVLLLAACAQNKNTKSDVWVMTSSTCNMPQTSFELDEGYILVKQNNEQYLGIIEIEPGITYGTKIKVKSWDKTNTPVWAADSFFYTTNTGATVDSLDCTTNFIKE